MRKRLGYAIALVVTSLGFVLSLGGPGPASAALANTLNFFLKGSAYEANILLYSEDFQRGLFVIFLILLFCWVLIPRQINLEKNIWELYFNPANSNDRKTVTFLSCGKIGEGRNFNENSWEVDGKILYIFSEDGNIQNCFVYNENKDCFVCLNAANAKGIPNQVIRRI